MASIPAPLQNVVDETAIFCASWRPRLPRQQMQQLLETDTLARGSADAGPRGRRWKGDPSDQREWTRHPEFRAQVQRLVHVRRVLSLLGGRRAYEGRHCGRARGCSRKVARLAPQRE